MTRTNDQAVKMMAEKEGKYLTLSLTGEEYGIEILKVKEIIGMMPITTVPRTPPHVKGVINLRGKVISVVDEVRNLAMRAADAAKNTANLIEGTVKRIKTGSDIVTKTNEAFGKVATGAKKVSELVGEITAASDEQAQGIEQISKTVAEMDKVVQKNAANAEESASASEEMNAQAEQMKDFVSELVTLVGGRNGNGVVSKKGTPSIRGGTSMVLHQPKGEAQKGHISPMKRSQEKKVPIPKFKEVRPNQVIPMEEADLKEF